MTVNSGKISGKKMPIGKRWQKGQSGNPAGRPKDSEAFSSIAQEIGSMDADELSLFVGDKSPMGRKIASLPRRVQVKYLVIIRVMLSLLENPSASLLREVLNRVDGKVKQKVQYSGGTAYSDNEARQIAVLIEKVYMRPDKEEA